MFINMDDIMDNYFNKDVTNILEDSPFLTSYEFDWDDGYGNILLYHLFPGIDLLFNDFISEDCNKISTSNNYEDYIIINHCNKGRFETIFKGNYIFLSEGDLVFSSGTDKYMHNFPLGYYNGLQIIINLNIAQKSIDNVIGKDIIDIRKLSEIIRDNGSFAIIRSNQEVEHVISELYGVDENIKRAYYKLKVIELLLFLKNSEIKSLEDEFPVLNAENVQKIKEIRKYLMGNIGVNVTLDDLSDKFHISQSTVKNYFKTIYGKPLFTWFREYRLNQAAVYLEKTTMSVSEISEKVGYQDHSKFTKAFKKYYSLTPLKYRNFHKN